MNEMQAIRQIRDSLEELVLLHIDEEGGQASFQSVARVSGSEQHASQATAELQSMGLVETEQSIGSELTLTSLGHSVAQQVKVSMATPERRDDAVQRAVLTWLEESEQQTLSLSVFLDTDRASVFGVQVTIDELKRASDFLMDRGFIKAVRTWQSNSPLRPSITIDGQKALLSDVTLSRYGPEGETTANNE